MRSFITRLAPRLATRIPRRYYSSDPRDPYGPFDKAPVVDPPAPETLVTLAIETSCDDTCVAVLEKCGSAARLLFEKKVTSDNKIYGGVHPATAVESHTAAVAPLVREAIRYLPNRQPGKRSFQYRKMTTGDIIAFKRLPDFVTSPSTTCKPTLSPLAWSTPSASPGPKPPQPKAPSYNPDFPFLTLLASGGHTQLVLSNSLTSHTILADSLNISVGDMLDKVGRTLLPPDILDAANDVMYAAQLERFAFPVPDPTPSNPSPKPDYSWYEVPPTRADEIKLFFPPEPYKWSLTPPLSQSRDMAFDFSGLGGQAQKILTQDPNRPLESIPIEERRELARGVMKLAFEHLASRVLFALQDMRGAVPHRSKQHPSNLQAAKKIGTTRARNIRTLVLSGGVASNAFLRKVLRDMLDARGFDDVEIVAPPPQLCTDNAAMVAWTGMEMYERGWQTALDVLPVRKWPFDPAQSGGGIMEIGGWMEWMPQGVEL
ncbi:uncharacterized protein CTHT_0059790 [Thermochaetoides thermophila DSM 1495]|uniref:N(6)-L-threonylcarbamoyladenine synthase n=1 Tax=Chaetomium thermophilum (strain DSM 1495 / CBS 144.50 / IMI 039719) TaxID=759272 RepID=G0SEV0_CHATD|nr:hypothetical protein CTHT_0059790 [Thermochaetoides thermophila DSM 1495]EGS17966.1 hypothetical protein CTHT_0059790 [Thermochaetoides thermophila DSM 1495]